MEKGMAGLLLSEGITPPTIKILEQEDVDSFRTFRCLKEEHFEALS